MGFHELRGYKEIESLSKNEKILVFKDSSTCPISARARANLEEFSRETGTPVYRLTVQTQRSLSNEVAEETGIKHESPQLILFQDGQPKGVLNHQMSVDQVKSLFGSEK